MIRRLWPLLVVAAMGLSACATSKTAEYVDPKTGQQYVCYRQAAFGVIPSVVAGNSYADCKTLFESPGFVRRDPKDELAHYTGTASGM